MATDWRWSEGLIQDFDEVAGKNSNRSWVAAQSSRPPGTITSIERFNQVAFDEAQVFLGLASP